jgi:hypothetical protein
MENWEREFKLLFFIYLLAITCQANSTELRFLAIVSRCPDTSICSKPPLGDSSTSFYLITYDTSSGYLFRTINKGFIHNGDSTVDMCSNEPEYWISKGPINRRNGRLYIDGVSEVHSMFGGRESPVFKDTLQLKGKWIVDRYGITYERNEVQKVREKWCAQKNKPKTDNQGH